MTETIEQLQPIPRARLPWRTRLRRWLGRYLPRPLTPAEKQELEAERKTKEFLKTQYKELLAEARKYENDIIEKLIDLNVCYRFKKTESDQVDKIKPISFIRPFGLRPEAIYLQIDLRPGRSPRGIGIEDLEPDHILRELSMACKHPVYFKYTVEHGAWYIVEREVGKRGIPAHVKYDDLQKQRPASADGLSLSIGISENVRSIFRSLGQMYSMLVAGTVGGGKSNFLNVLLCELITYNSPHRLKLILVDLKGGVEFSFYQGVPHLLNLPVPPPPKPKKRKTKKASDDDDETEDENTVEAYQPPVLTTEDDDTGPKLADVPKRPAIIEKRDDVPYAFDWLIREGEARMVRLKKKKVKSIGQYNFQNRNHPMPHIVVVIDEWADVKLGGDGGKDAEERLINIASRFRAVGIHVILCTQVPNKDVVSIRIKNVLPAKVVFACPDQYASMLIVGDASAHGLSPEGRCIYIWGKNRMEVQTPFINNKTVESTVEMAIAGKFNDVETSTHDVTDQEILEWSLNSNNGELDYRAVHTQYRLRGLTQEQAKAICKSFEGEEVTIGASTYKVMPGAGSRARRLLPLVESEITDEQNTPETDAGTT